MELLNLNFFALDFFQNLILIGKYKNYYNIVKMFLLESLKSSMQIREKA